MNSFYSFRYCCRWCLHMQVKTSADSLFTSLRNRIFWLDNDRAAYLISIRNFVPIRKTTFRMSYKNSSWISLTKYAVEVNHFMKEIIKPAFNVCTLRTDRDDSDEHVAVKLTHSHSLLLFPTVGLSGSAQLLAQQGKEHDRRIKSPNTRTYTHTHTQKRCKPLWADTPLSNSFHEWTSDMSDVFC